MENLISAILIAYAGFSDSDGCRFRKVYRSETLGANGIANSEQPDFRRIRLNAYLILLNFTNGLRRIWTIEYA